MSDPTKEQIQEAGQAILAILDCFSSEHRDDVLDVVRDKYCLHSGAEASLCSCSSCYGGGYSDWGSD